MSVAQEEFEEEISDEAISKLIGVIQKAPRRNPGSGQFQAVSETHFPCGHPKVEGNYTQQRNCKECHDRISNMRYSQRKSALAYLKKHQRFTAMIEARIRGNSWEEIAEQFGYSQGRNAHRWFDEQFEKYNITEPIPELRGVHSARLEHMYRALLPAIDAQNSHTPRAVEVGIKVLERQAHLHGLDVVEEAQVTGKGNLQQQAVVINITAHPGDETAQALLIEGGRREMGRGEGASQVFSPSNPGLPEHKEDNLLSGWDRQRENMVRAILDSRKAQQETSE